MMGINIKGEGDIARHTHTHTYKEVMIKITKERLRDGVRDTERMRQAKREKESDTER